MRVNEVFKEVYLFLPCLNVFKHSILLRWFLGQSPTHPLDRVAVILITLSIQSYPQDKMKRLYGDPIIPPLIYQPHLTTPKPHPLNPLMLCGSY